MVLITNWAKVEQFAGSNRFVDNYSVSIPSVKNYNNENKKLGLSKSDKMPSSLTLLSSSEKYILAPILIGGGIFITSALRSFKDTEHQNKKLTEFYVTDRVKNIHPSQFLDFPEPRLMIPK